MKPDNVVDRLEMLRPEKDLKIDIPEIVEFRLEETFGRIRAEAAALPVSAGRGRRLDQRTRSAGRSKARRLLRWAAVTAASLLLLGAGMLGLGYISPAFADSMRTVPVLGSLFSQYGDKGLQAAEEQGLVQPLELTETRGDTTISVRNVIYDGTRIVLEVHRESEGSFYSQDLRDPRQGELTWVEAHLQDQELLPSWRPAGDDYVLVSINHLLQSEQSDQAPLQLSLTVEGFEQPFHFEVPLEKIEANMTVIEKPEMPQALEQRGFVVDKVVVTPVTTQVFYHLRPKSEDISNTFVHPDDFDMSDATDDQGRVYQRLGGLGEPETEEGSKQHQLFEPLDPAADVLKLTFNVAGGPDGKPYTSIEMEVPLPDRQQ
ncbi:DUF4179 domain-containing protein [Paenibacillus tepidiphilus]|uniref:DUF4179 domain-containing protein n=1 Tax=Paenibacillus tepidiphilus TaxID=2608683 RepID=UPI00123C5982|nr:DUF4179 domain-containing protein [Paenibacillus tepidiphilus]